MSTHPTDASEQDRDSRRARSVNRQRAEPEPSQPVSEPDGEASEPLSARGSKQGLQLRKLFKKFVAFGAHRAEGAKIGVLLCTNSAHRYAEFVESANLFR